MNVLPRPARILAISTGRIQAFAAPSASRAPVPSAIRKRPVSTPERPDPVAVRGRGLEGDEQADLRFHGGPTRAVHAYPSEHYAFWNTLRMQARNGGSLRADPHAPPDAVPDAAPVPLPWGAMGENLTTAGLMETDLWIGDEVVVGTVRLRVTGPREPCWKLGAALGFSWAPKMMAQSGFTGCYLAVIEPGNIAAGDEIVVHAGERVLSLRESFALRDDGRQASLFQDD